jgi:membrane protein
MSVSGVLGPWPRAFWDRAYKENITGLAGMVAYNLMLAIFPFALLILFGFGKFANTGSIEHSVVLDLQRLFPNVEQETLMNAIERVRESSTTLGVAAVVGGVWIGSSFWGAMDTAFCRIYHVECRSWVEQKRFALVMLLALTLLIAASVVVPTLEGAALSSAEDLPFGLSGFGAVRSGILIGAGLLISFGVVCAI